MKFRFLILLISLLIGLFGCKKVRQKRVASKFESEWFSIDGYLQIDSTHTFKYVRQTCISKAISNGTWKTVNNTLVLNSFAPKGCYFIENFKIESPKDTLKIVKNLISEKDCEPNTGYVNFKDEKFYIKDTILISKNAPYYDYIEYNHHTNFRRKSYHK